MQWDLLYSILYFTTHITNIFFKVFWIVVNNVLSYRNYVHKGDLKGKILVVKDVNYKKNIEKMLIFLVSYHYLRRKIELFSLVSSKNSKIELFGELLDYLFISKFHTKGNEHNNDFLIIHACIY